jgi:hypothetical protein
MRHLHINVTPQIPNIRSAHVGHPDSNCATSSKDDLKDRLISLVRHGADGNNYQALMQETDTWLEEQAPEEVSELSLASIIVDDIS